MGTENENGSSKHIDGKPLLVEGNSSSFSTPSSISSSSSSSLDEFNNNEKGLPKTISQFDGNSQSVPDSTFSPHWSALRNASQMKSPPVQTMGRPGEYDPNRIPASVFATKPSNLTEWSVASNESLFSIHMGNNSFSRDSFLLFAKTGELPKLDDWNNSHSQINLPPVMEAPADEGIEIDDNISPKVRPEPKMENHVKEKIAHAEVAPLPLPLPLPPTKVSLDKVNSTVKNLNSSSSNPRLSDESGHSASSFQFPVLVSDGAKSSSSLDVVIEKTEKPEPETPKAQKATTPKASETTRWFSCFGWLWCC